MSEDVKPQDLEPTDDELREVLSVLQDVPLQSDEHFDQLLNRVRTALNKDLEVNRRVRPRIRGRFGSVDADQGKTGSG